MIKIYGLKCSVTHRVYVGCTKGSLLKRMREHRCLLNAGKHSAKLQTAWNDNPGCLHMTVIEELPDLCDTILKREKELFWMKRFRKNGLLLNEHEISYEPLKTKESLAKMAESKRGKPRTAEANLKRSLAQKGKPKNHGSRISYTKQMRKEIVLSAPNDKV